MSEIRVTDIKGEDGSAAVNFSKGINISSGVCTATTFSGSGASLTSLAANQLSSGTIPDARFPSTLPAASGANLTGLTASQIPNLNTSKITAGTLPTTRGGTGLTSLGSAGKVLKVNSSANGLEYGDGGGWVQIASGTGPASAATSINLDNIFSATYKFYKVFIKWTQDDWLKVRLITAGGVTDTGQAYTWVGYSSSENADSNQRFGSNASTYGIATYYNGTDNSNCITELTFSNPYDSSIEGIWTWFAAYREGNKMWQENGGCINTNNASYRGIHLFGHNGDSIAATNFNYVVLGTGT